METMIRTTAGKSNQQNNITGIRSIEGEYFSHFGIIKANLFREFGAFRRNNNNNLPSPLPSLGFEKELERGFNSPLRENLKALDSNVIALVNALTEVNLGINYIEREFNYIKLTEFRRTETENLNEQLEQYNRIIEANKWFEYRRFQIIERYFMKAVIRQYDEIKIFITSWNTSNMYSLLSLLHQ